ncbi:MAG: AAA family ATPase [Candidatus Omnitrophota bacterium]
MYTIAIAGKGGTGKTTIAGMIVRCLCEQGKGSLLAVDADPNSNLGDVLGLDPKENIGAIIDEISRNIDKIPAGMTKDRYIEYRLQSALEEGRGVDLLVMGRPEGPGCYCYANNVLRGIIGRVCEDYEFVVMDNEAGLEHLSRRTMRRADCLFIVSDPTPVGITAAKRIYDIVRELNLEIKKTAFIINRFLREDGGAGLDKQGLAERLPGGEIKFVPFDKQVLDLSLSGRAIGELDKENPTLKAVEEIIMTGCSLKPEA